MVIYMYLTILVVTCIITGIIVTIIERKGFYPKIASKKQPVEKKKEETVSVQAIQPAPVVSEPVYMAPVVESVPVEPVVSSPAPVVSEPAFTAPVEESSPVASSSAIEPVPAPVISPPVVEVPPIVPAPVETIPVVDVMPIASVVANVDPTITEASTVMNMEPVSIEEPTTDYNIPVLLSSYTVDLQDVVQTIQTIEIPQSIVEDPVVPMMNQIGDFYESH